MRKILCFILQGCPMSYGASDARQANLFLFLEGFYLEKESCHTPHSVTYWTTLYFGRVVCSSLFLFFSLNLATHDQAQTTFRTRKPACVSS